MNSPQHYLDYLDKEMTIMGILSTFCVAVPTLIIERIFSASKESIGYSFLLDLHSKGLTYIIIASCLFLIGATLFYKQRSTLAWYYGQISLEFTMPNYTGHSLEQWLVKADSWETWMPYNSAYWIIVISVLNYILALFSTFIPFIKQYDNYITLINILLIVILLLLIRRNSEKFKNEEKLPYFRFK